MDKLEGVFYYIIWDRTVSLIQAVALMIVLYFKRCNDILINFSKLADTGAVISNIFYTADDDDTTRFYDTFTDQTTDRAETRNMSDMQDLLLRNQTLTQV